MTTHRVPHLLALVCLVWSLPALAARCHVDAGAASATHDGQGWATAYTDLQDALRDATCTEVWVAQGVYVPVTPADANSVSNAERAISFVIPPGVAVYGGFAGDETSRDARDPAAHPTVLSGDIDRNDAHAGNSGIDATIDDIAGSNSQHVVMMDGVSGAPVGNSTVLDGFTITGGDAGVVQQGAQSPIQIAGGGLLCNGYDLDAADQDSACSPTLANLHFSGNRASTGGAMACFTQYGTCGPVFANVDFSGNTATGIGVGGNPFGAGGILIYEAGGTTSAVLTDVSLSNNHAGNGTDGGAISVISIGGGTLDLTRVRFDGNSAQLGGGLAIIGPNPLVSAVGAHLRAALTDVSFMGNQAAQLPPDQSGGGDGSGGGLYCLSCDLALNNVTFTGNSASSGGGLSLASIDLVMDVALDNVTFHDNTATKIGGAMVTAGASLSAQSTLCPRFNHVTFHDDHASTLIPAASSLELMLQDSSTACHVRIDNSILWNDTAAGASLVYGILANVDFDHAIVSGGCPTDPAQQMTFSCSDVLAGDPRLGALTDNGGFTPTLLPGADSAALDAATCSGPTTDQRGLQRPQGAACDIGAVERIVATTLDVAVVGAGRVDASVDRPDLLVSGNIVACTAAGGTTCSADFAQHTIVTLTATPDAHWHFTGWSGDCGGANLGTSVVLDAAAHCTASFAIDSLTVTASAPGGHGSIAPPSQSVGFDAAASFTVTPDVGYHVAGVNGDTCTVTGSGSDYQATNIQADCAVTASFAIDSHTVTASVDGGHGSVSPASRLVDYGGTAQFTVTPDAGYQVASVSGCGGTLAGDVYTTAAITGDCAIVVVYAQALPPVPTPTLDWRMLVLLAGVIGGLGVTRLWRHV
jgi:hypothetical protein